MNYRSWIVAMMMMLIGVGSARAVDEPTRTRGRAVIGQGGASASRKVDANGDGKISRPEFEAIARKLAERGQGKGQGQAMVGKVFDRLDADGDGSLSPSEMGKLKQLRDQNRGGAATGKSRRSGSRPGNR